MLEKDKNCFWRFANIQTIITNHVPSLVRFNFQMFLWILDGTKHELSHDLREKSVFSSLEILFVDRTDDFVPYTCEGNNSEGSTRDTVNIQVLGKTNTIEYNSGN